jgi:hemerythrin
LTEVKQDPAISWSVTVTRAVADAAAANESRPGCHPGDDSVASRTARPLIGRQHTLGHVAIDRDHTAIADWWLRAVSCEPIQSAFFIARLKKLMRDHFERETKLMEWAGGRLCECHAREHRMLLDLCDQATVLSGCNWGMARSLLRTKLPKLVREHIISMDQLAVLFINANGAIARAC